MNAVKRYPTFDAAMAALAGATGWPGTRIVTLCGMDVDSTGAHVPDEYDNGCYAPNICDGYALMMVKGRTTKIDSRGFPVEWVADKYELEDGRVGRPG